MRRFVTWTSVALLAFLLLHHRRTAPHRDKLTFVPEDDAAMRAAINRARSTVPTFVQRLRHSTDTQTFASVKLPLKEGETVEHVWISGLRFDGVRFYGRIDNDVQAVKGWRLGDTVSVPADSISDWLIIEDSIASGGYSIRVLHDKMSARARAEWDAAAPYRFAKDSAPVR